MLPRRLHSLLVCVVAVCVLLAVQAPLAQAQTLGNDCRIRNGPYSVSNAINTSVDVTMRLNADCNLASATAYVRVSRQGIEAWGASATTTINQSGNTTLTVTGLSPGTAYQVQADVRSDF